MSDCHAPSPGTDALMNETTGGWNKCEPDRGDFEVRLSHAESQNVR